MQRWPNKDPDANIDYAVDWSERLEDGETITDSQWSVDDNDLVIGSDSITDGVCSVWLSGGVSGTEYQVTNRITTSRGMIDDKTVAIRVIEQ